MIKGMQKEEGRMKNGERAVPANGEKLRVRPPGAFQAEASPKAQLLEDRGCVRSTSRSAFERKTHSNFRGRGRTRHPRARRRPTTTHEQVPNAGCDSPSPWERAGVREYNRPFSATGVPYTLSKSILEKIWLERLRQKQLLREGKIFFACDSPVVSHDRKLRVLTEELGEVAAAIDQIEILNPLRQPRAELSEPSARAKNNLRDELAQIAARRHRLARII